ncbi:A-kinase anchor protein 17B-like [Tachyglossus aculeatus]|uniref:A-kinase anchor protein 17B-like n=1 Tax=Tachyglossus aculeatus TaxID=9261 RepID=UPI0018F67D5E|nr:A-kinase anchor protein 17B-like [Tachyglossus aculeatus]
MTITIVYDNSEAMELCAAQHLYLKPIAKLTINVMLPEDTEPARSFSNWEVLDQLKNLICPDQFTTVRVSKSTKDFIRFEGEAETKSLVQTLKAKLHGKLIKLNGLKNDLKVVATDAQVDFPSQQEWESFLSKNEAETDELPEHSLAESPDSIYFEGLPCKWFAPKGSSGEKPCEDILRVVFESFGKIKNIDIPMLDPYREEMTGGSFGNFSFGGLQTFEAFIQYQEYTDFVKAMESLRGMKLMLKGDDGKALACNIKVMFDTTKHFSEGAIKKRNLERLKLQELEQERKIEKKREEEETERKRKDDEKKSRERKRKAKLKRKEQKQKEREEKRLKKHQRAKAEELWPGTGDEWEERKYLLAQRRVEALRLLRVLLRRVTEFGQFNKQKVENTSIEAREGSASERELKTLEKERSNPHQRELEETRKCQCTKSDNTSVYKKEQADLPASSYHIVKTFFNDATKEGSGQLLTSRHNHSYVSDLNSLQITINQDCKIIHSLKRKDCHVLDISHSPKLREEGYCRKEKIYETEEFIHYLLNYYQTPRYPRICIDPMDTMSRSWWQRAVLDKGNGFQVNLKNQFRHHFTRVRIVQNLEKGDWTPEDHFRWKITIKESEPKLRENVKQGSMKGFTKGVKIDWTDSLRETVNETSYVNVNSYPFRSIQSGHDEDFRCIRKRNLSPPCQLTGSACELEDLLEEISSDSECFNEAFSGPDRGTERRYTECVRYPEGANCLMKEREGFCNCAENVACDQGSWFSHCTTCAKLKPGGLTKHCRHRLCESGKRSKNKQRCPGPERYTSENEGNPRKKPKKPPTEYFPDEGSYSDSDSNNPFKSLREKKKRGHTLNQKVKCKAFLEPSSKSSDTCPVQRFPQSTRGLWRAKYNKKDIGELNRYGDWKDYLLTSGYCLNSFNKQGFSGAETFEKGDPNPFNPKYFDDCLAQESSFHDAKRSARKLKTEK